MHRPANLHLLPEHLVDPHAYFLVGDKLSLIELAEPRFYLLAEPRVMVKIMLNELPDIFFRAAVIFRRNLRQLRLEFGAEIHFHKARLGADSGTFKCP
jgi:hypothetical protein